MELLLTPVRLAAGLWLVWVAFTLPGLRHLTVQYDLAGLYASFTGQETPTTTRAVLVVDRPRSPDLVPSLQAIPGVLEVHAPQEPDLDGVPDALREKAAHALAGKPADDVDPIGLTLDASAPPLEAIESLGAGDLVGISVMNRAHAQAAKSAQKRLAALIGIGLSLPLFALFKRPRDVLLVLGSVGTGVVALAGAMGWAERSLGGPNLLLLPLLAVLGFADALHFLRALGTAPPGTPAERSAHALHEVVMPCVLTSVTTALAFLALLSSHSPPVREFGLLAALGMGLALVAGLILPAAVLSFVDGGGARPAVERASETWTDRLHRLPAVAVLALVPLLGLAWTLETDLQLGGELPDGDPTLATQRRVDASLGGVFPLRLELETDVAEGTADPDAAAHLLRLQRALSKDAAVGAVVSYADALEWAAETRGRRAVQITGDVGSRAPGRNKRFRRVHEAAEEAAGPAFATLFDDDRSAYVVQVRYRDVGARAWRRSVEHLEGYATARTGLRVTMAGYVPLAVDMLREIPAEAARVLGMSLGAALLVVGIRFRSFRDAVLVVPILGATLITALGLLVVVGLPLNHTAIFVLSLAVGLGVDPWLHLLDQGLSRAGPAILWTTGVLGAGFLSLSLSSLPTVRAISVVLLGATVVNAMVSLAMFRFRGAGFQR